MTFISPNITIKLSDNIIHPDRFYNLNEWFFTCICHDKSHNYLDNTLDRLKKLEKQKKFIAKIFRKRKPIKKRNYKSYG
jgi:hypothetical protein